MLSSFLVLDERGMGPITVDDDSPAMYTFLVHIGI